jgi:hypothetical protein
MDDEYYDQDGHDDGQHFADTEEEAHFYATIAEFISLLDVYSPQFVMMTMLALMKERENTLNSIN